MYSVIRLERGASCGGNLWWGYTGGSRQFTRLGFVGDVSGVSGCLLEGFICDVVQEEILKVARKKKSYLVESMEYNFWNFLRPKRSLYLYLLSRYGILKLKIFNSKFFNTGNSS